MSKECRVQTGMKSFLKFMPKKAIILVSNSNVKSCLKGLYNYERFLLKPPRLGLHRLAVLHADLNKKKKKERLSPGYVCLTPWKPLIAQQSHHSQGRHLPYWKLCLGRCKVLPRMFSGSMLPQRGHQIFQNAKITHGLLYTNSTKTHIFKPPFPTVME